MDEVEEREPRRLVLLGDRHHQTEVRLDERLLGLLAGLDLAPQLTTLGRGEVLHLGGQVELGGTAPFDGLRQADLVVLGEQRVLPDVGQVEPDQVFLVALDALLRQRLNPSSETLRRSLPVVEALGQRMQLTCGYQFTDRVKTRALRRQSCERPPATCPGTLG